MTAKITTEKHLRCPSSPQGQKLELWAFSTREILRTVKRLQMEHFIKQIHHIFTGWGNHF